MALPPRDPPPPLLISGATVVGTDGVWSPGWLAAAGGRIQSMGPGEAPGGVRAEISALGVVVDGRGAVLLPGFIDVHVHGGDGADAMDADPDGLRRMARFHASHGVTSLLPTTWSAPPAALEAAVGAIADVVGPVDGGATILGAHLEGPWINPARAGAQDPAGIRPPDIAEARRLLDIRPGPRPSADRPPHPASPKVPDPSSSSSRLAEAPAAAASSSSSSSSSSGLAGAPAAAAASSSSRVVTPALSSSSSSSSSSFSSGLPGVPGVAGSTVVKLVALAPEMPGSADVIRECRSRGVVAAAGHTEASWEEMVAAVATGVRHVTHTFNAMGGFGHRQPGTAGAALALPQLRCELIADGHHVHAGAMAVLARAKGPEGVLLISDAVRAAGLPEGDVDLGGRPASHCCGAVRLPDGTLAGSVLTLDVALRNFAAATGWGWADLARATAGNAATALGLSSKGRLARGLDADLVLLGDDGSGEVLLTVVEGRIAHRRS